jgi:hypothetical protein
MYSTLTPKISRPFWWILGLKHVHTCMDKDKNEMIYVSTSNCKALYPTIPIVCRKKLAQSDGMDWNIITIEGEEKIYFEGVPRLMSMFWNSIEIRCIGLQCAKV